MKSIVQRLSPSKSRSTKRLSTTSVAGTIAFSSGAMEITPVGDVSVELLSDRLVVQDSHQANLKGLFFTEIRDIEWNYADAWVKFSLHSDSVLIVALATLSEFEECLMSVLHDAKLAPVVAYTGVFAGAKQPRILQQRRATLVPAAATPRPKVPLAKRRELLMADRPPPTTEPTRETLAWEYIRDGTMTFAVTSSSSSSSVIFVDTHVTIHGGENATSRVVPYDVIQSCVRRALTVNVTLVKGELITLSCAVAHHLCHVFWFYMNRVQLVPGSYYGRPVYKPTVDDARSVMGAVSTTSPSSSPPVAVTSTLQHQGPLSKTASEGFHLTQSWKKKHACLYDTPLGGYFCYFDSGAAADRKDKKDAKTIDLSSVLCLRPHSAINDAPKFAFDIVTLYRTWSFCAADAADLAHWLHVLGDFVDRSAAIAPDVPLACDVRLAHAPASAATSRDMDCHLSVSAHGVSLSSTLSWYYTDIHKWSLVLQPTPSLYLSCFVDDQCLAAGDFLFQTKNAPALCQAIEFHVAKCLAKVDVLHAAATSPASPFHPSPPPIPPQSRLRHATIVKLPPPPPMQSFRRVLVPAVS
ncbi:Aste57867_19272 [Aphanomyces stellatus]|uniref:Aste57867_19272 protein n=1 Tax=Aphanomyces stellatus TaxID=120398 RepID=A0A485LCZ5_9STRA|nr:hypothetical protein As57867_019208 [Aphanomyces stellatus]VFT95992.1 Aste57867_19272 [Aphanomyces stellatus]